MSSLPLRFRKQTVVLFWASYCSHRNKIHAQCGSAFLRWSLLWHFSAKECRYVDICPKVFQSVYMFRLERIILPPSTLSRQSTSYTTFSIAKMSVNFVSKTLNNKSIIHWLPFIPWLNCGNNLNGKEKKKNQQWKLGLNLHSLYPDKQRQNQSNSWLSLGRQPTLLQEDFYNQVKYSSAKSITVCYLSCFTFLTIVGKWGDSSLLA